MDSAPVSLEVCVPGGGGGSAFQAHYRIRIAIQSHFGFSYFFFISLSCNCNSYYVLNTCYVLLAFHLFFLTCITALLALLSPVY